MKSFEQFEYEKSLLDEASIVGANVGQRFQRNASTFQRGNTSSAQYSKEIGDGAKGPMNRRQAKGPAKTSSQEKTTEKVKVLGTQGVRQEPGGQGSKAPSIPTRPGRRSDGSKKTGVAATIERNKARAKDFAKSERGQKIGRTVGGALGAARNYRPDAEAVDTGASGMGTQLRQMRGIGAAAIDGAIKGYQNRTKDAKKNDRNVTGVGKQSGRSGSDGKPQGLLGLGFSALKNEIKKKVGIDDKKTEGGQKITGDVESRYRKGQQERQKKRDQEAERKRPREQTPASAAATKSPSVTGSDQPKTERTPEQEREKALVNQRIGGGTGETKRENIKKQRKTDATIEIARRDKKVKKQVEREADKLSSDELGNARNTPKGKKTLDDIFAAARRIGDEEDAKTKKFEDDVKRTNVPVKSSSSKVTKTQDTPASKQTVDVSATKVDDDKLPSSKKPKQLPSSKKPKQVTGSSPNQKSLPAKGESGGTKVVKATTVKGTPKKLKRPNIRNAKYKNNRELYDKDRKAYNAQSPENKTKVGNQGRPKKEPEVRPATRGEARRAINNATRNKGTKPDNKKSEVKEATNVIKMAKQAKQQGKITKMRSYSQMKKDEAREAAIRRAQNEQFSHWREEFLWEVDKKYPDKVKEIKPMSGKNTIIINPEDESAKYKRGY